MKVDFAAAYCGEARSTFLNRVQEGIYPQPTKVGRNSYWYIEDLDAALDEQKEAGGSSIEADRAAMRAVFEGLPKGQTPKV